MRIIVTMALICLGLHSAMGFRSLSRTRGSITQRHLLETRQYLIITRSTVIQSNTRLFASTSSSTMEHNTLTPGAINESEVVIKKSRFLALAKHVSSWAEAQAFVEQTKIDHPKARHWCSGFRGVVMVENDDGESSSSVITERCSDDGEPSGTAGQPILNAIQTEGDLVNAVCVVVRYSGGIKLGAGGLIRAYGGVAREVLRQAPQEVVIPTSSFVASKIAAQYVGSVYDCVSKFGGTTNDETYDDGDGSLTLSITCNWNVAEEIQETLKDSTRGEVQFTSGTPGTT